LRRALALTHAVKNRSGSKAKIARRQLVMLRLADLNSTFYVLTEKLENECTGAGRGDGIVAPSPRGGVRTDSKNDSQAVV
jgi:hypothetical protein